ncbi:phage tail protein, partial [Cronobacter sakazakii]
YKGTQREYNKENTDKVTKHLPMKQIAADDTQTITAERADGQVYVLSNAWLHGEANNKHEEGTVDLEFHGEEGFYQ